MDRFHRRRWDRAFDAGSVGVISHRVSETMPSGAVQAVNPLHVVRLAKEQTDGPSALLRARISPMTTATRPSPWVVTGSPRGMARASLPGGRLGHRRAGCSTVHATSKDGSVGQATRGVRDVVRRG